MKIVAVGDEDTIIGMQLAGVKEAFVRDNSEQVLTLLRELSTREDVAVILITEKLASNAQDLISQIQQEKTYPIIVEIPDKSGKLEKETDALKDLVRRAVGVELDV